MLTDSTATVEFMPEEGFTYRLKVSKMVAEVWTVVMEYVYPEPADASGEGAADASGEGAADASGEGAADASGEGAADASGEGAADASGEGAADASGEGAADASGSRRKRDVTPVTHEFTGLESNVVYKISMTSEGNVGETVLTSDPVEVEFTTCKFF